MRRGGETSKIKQGTGDHPCRTARTSITPLEDVERKRAGDSLKHGETSSESPSKLDGAKLLADLGEMR